MDARRCFFSARIMASEELQAISVSDVYDQAAGIAHEFDRMIQSYGNDSVTELMPKVIKSLEQLENLAGRYERDVEEINQLRYKIEKMEADKTEKAQERSRLDLELEAIEENWQSEVKDLLDVVTKLQEENKRLRESIKDEKHAAVAEIQAQRFETEEQEIKVLNKLKETVDKQREELRQTKREMKQKAVDCDALQAQLERLAKFNADLRRKNTTQKKQAQTLLDEKADLEVQLHAKDEEVERVKHHMTEQEKYDEQRAAVKEAIQSTQKSLEEDDDSTKPQSPESDGEPMREQLAKAAAQAEGGEEGEASPGSPTSGFDLEGKLIIDLKDPNRPRFTLQELRQVLMERNELKTKLIEVEDELSHYRPREDSNIRDQDVMKSSYMGEEVLVYGPINREPDEKVTGKKDSGIRKLFLRVLEAGIDTFLGSEEVNMKKEGVCEVPMYSKTISQNGSATDLVGSVETEF